VTVFYNIIDAMILLDKANASDGQAVASKYHYSGNLLSSTNKVI
jgi:hypothetical protein